MDKFIYVFDTAAKDCLLQAGFLLLKADEQNSIYVFSMDDTIRFAELAVGFSYVTSNTLTF